MLNEEFLKGLFEKEDVSLDDKIKSIIAEHDADTRGLVQKRDELLGNEKKLKDKISVFEKSKGEYESNIANLNDLLNKANKGNDVTKEQYESKLAKQDSDFKKQLKDVSDNRDFYKKLHLNSLFEKAMENGVKDLNIIPGLKDGFIARITSMNDFQPKEVDGNIVFLNKDNHTVGEVVSNFAMTNEGKAYIRNASSGGGARGSSQSDFGNAKELTSQQIENMNDQQLMEFALKGGKVVN